MELMLIWAPGPRSRLLVTSGISGKPMCEHLTSGFACPGYERLAVLGLNA